MQVLPQHDVDVLIVNLLRYASTRMEKNRARRLLNLKNDQFEVLLQKCAVDGTIDVGKNYLQLTKQGQVLLRNTPVQICPQCIGTGVLAMELDSIKSYCTERPEPDVTIDQCPIIPVDLARRAYLMNERGDVNDKRILCVGDMDLCSIAIAELGKPREICVLDKDERVLRVIERLASKMNFPIMTVNYDIVDIVKGRFPSQLEGEFDTFETDPPYTEVGMKLFARAGIRALKRDGVAYITVPYLPLEAWSSDMLYQVQSYLVKSGFVMTDCIRAFHECEHENRIIASMIRAQRIEFSSLLDERLDLRKLYTYR